MRILQPLGELDSLPVVSDSSVREARDGVGSAPLDAAADVISARVEGLSANQITPSALVDLMGRYPHGDSACISTTWANGQYLDVRRREIPPDYRRAKRMLDVVLAMIGLVICAPLIVVLAILIRLDSQGPSFFRQLRVGEGGRLFTINKMRTMRQPDPDDVAIADAVETESDRITRMGRHLRRWSLDELPQLVNVLRGEMSLVGPRPERPEIVLSRYEDWQYQRFLVPQGMTGWWQVTDRGKTRLCDDTQDDLFYLCCASFSFDLKILMMTLPAVIRQAGDL